MADETRTPTVPAPKDHPSTASMLSDRDLLVRIDERTKAIERTVADFPTRYISTHEFHPVRKIVYGFAGLILTGVIVAVIGMVIHK